MTKDNQPSDIEGSETQDIKPCPFCNKPFEVVHSGGEGIYDGVLIKHDPNIDCPIKMDGENGYIYAQDELLNMLNTRPIEDALRLEISELQAENASLKDQKEHMIKRIEQLLQTIRLLEDDSEEDE